MTTVIEGIAGQELTKKPCRTQSPVEGQPKDLRLDYSKTCMQHVATRLDARENDNVLLKPAIILRQLFVICCTSLSAYMHI